MIAAERIHLPAVKYLLVVWMRTRLVLIWWTLAACRQNGSLSQSSVQQNVPCPTAAHLAVNDTLSLGELYSYLDQAEKCNVKPSISVDWGGTVEINQSIAIPSGVELRIRGGGYGYYEDDVTSSSSNIIGIDIDDDSTAAKASVIRGNGNVRLFFVNKTGILFISGITLQNGWGVDDGGGGIYAFGETTVVSVNCFWESLSAVGKGGAIATTSMSNLTLKGTNIFSNCSSFSRGGAIYLDSATLGMHGGVRFENCTAERKGGGIYTKNKSLLTVAEGASISFSGCTAGSQDGDNGGGICSYDSSITVGANAKVSFENNSVPVNGDGGGLFAKNTSIIINKGANVSLVNNHAEGDGGGMYIQRVDPDDYNGEEDMITCFTLAEGANAKFFRNTVARYGGGVHFSIGCDVVFAGDVHFEQNFGERAGAMYMDMAKAVISGRATFVNNTAERWGGAVMVVDSDSGLELSGPVIFQNNSAHRSGGALYLEVARFVVTSSNGGENAGAVWEGNSAGYDGGVVAVDAGEVYLKGGFASSNRAYQRGGVLFAFGGSLLSWTTGESWGNSALSGGSVYISNSEVNLTDVRFVEDHTPSGGVMIFADANARLVNTSIVAPAQLMGDFALHIGANSVVKMFSCSFQMWSGNYNLIINDGQLVMDACDFSQSSNIIILRSSEPATIRNAILGDKNYASMGYNTSTVLSSDANMCSTLPVTYSCLSNGNGEDCVDANYGMGVLCTDYIAAATGGTISLGGGGSQVELVPTSDSVSSSKDSVYFPDLITKELILRYSSASSRSEGAGVEGMATDAVLWEFRSSNESEYGGSPTDDGLLYGVSADNFSWIAMPVSGVLVKGQEVTIRLVGTPPPVKDPRRPSAVYNGEVSATFHVLSRTAEVGFTIDSSAPVRVFFYYCPVGAYWDGQSCASCVDLMLAMTDGKGSLECDIPGVTLETLPLASGYWRGDVNRTIIQSCPLAEACKGGRGKASLTDAISTENFIKNTRYCATGYTGPYCGVCAEGFRRLSGYQCLNCESEWDAGAIVAFWFAVAMTPVLLISLIMFLFGGTRSFKQLWKKIKVKCGKSKPGGVTQWRSEESLETPTMQEEAEKQESARARGFGALVLRAIPFQQVKILIVVWQILTQFSDVAEIPYPSTYKRFLSIMDVFNFDILWPLSAMCLVRDINFYEKLLIETLGPIIMLGALGLSCVGAMRCHRGTERNAVENRRQAKVRHASTALLVLFLVFSSVSTTIFSTFSCDYVEDLEVGLLRADYSVSCEDEDYQIYKVYAGMMIALYPVGIPVLFSFLLFKHRVKINPLAATEATRTIPLDLPVRGILERGRNITTSYVVPSRSLRANGSGDEGLRAAVPTGRPRIGTRGQRASERPMASTGRNKDSCDDTHEEVLLKRVQDLDLQPTKFLWEPYEPRTYYFETVECGRRCLMTGVLVFVLPNTAGQVAGACIFAFVTLLGFELIRPHLSPNDTWMYRIGCIVIFFSNFLGLMAKMDISGENAQSQDLFGVLLVCIHATMFITIIAQSCLAIQAERKNLEDRVDDPQVARSPERQI